MNYEPVLLHCDYDSDEYDSGDIDDYEGDIYRSGYYAPPIAPRWRFLRDFIGLVGGRFAPEQPRRLHTDGVRLGRDSADWWINVAFENGAFVDGDDELADDRPRRYRTVRDATLLLGVLARVDYDAFLALPIRRGRFDAPQIMNIDVAELPGEFNFFFCPDLEPREYAWARLRDVFGGQRYSATFRSHLAAIDKIAQAQDAQDLRNEERTMQNDETQSRRRKLLAPITIKFSIRPDRTRVPNQVAIINHITTIVREVHQLEAHRANAPDTKSKGALVPPVFHLECISLDLREFSFDASVLRALAELLLTGVRFASLTLPENVDEGQGDVSQLILAWASFLVVALGARTQPPTTSVVIDHLVLPVVYTTNLFLAPFLSALRYSTTVKSLHIEASDAMDDTHGSQRQLWGGLGYALFNASSSHGVESLQLTGHQLTDEALREFWRLAAARDPNLEWLNSCSRQRYDDTPICVNYPLGIVHQGAPIGVLTQTGRFPPINLLESFLGEVLVVYSNVPEIVMLVPGFGFVAVDGRYVQPVNGYLPRMVPPRRVTSLIFNGKSVEHSYSSQSTAVTTNPFLPQLLQIIGPSLTSLGLLGDDLDDVCVHTAIQSCSRLDNLLVDSTAVTSLSHLVSAYEQGVGAQPSSIDLCSVAVPAEAINGFLERLADPRHPLHRKLRRLSIGQRWRHRLGRSTGDRIRTMLASNRRLSHLYVSSAQDFAWNPQHDELNGDYILGPPLPLRSRAAFLSVVRYPVVHALRFGASTTITTITTITARLSDDVLRLVFAFARETTRRVVLLDVPGRVRHCAFSDDF